MISNSSSIRSSLISTKGEGVDKQFAKNDNHHIPNNIDNLIAQNSEKELNTSLFRCKAMIIALKNAKDAVSTRFMLKYSASEKRKKINEFIDQLNNLITNNNLNSNYLENYNRNII